MIAPFFSEEAALKELEKKRAEKKRKKEIKEKGFKKYKEDLRRKAEEEAKKTDEMREEERYAEKLKEIQNIIDEFKAKGYDTESFRLSKEFWKERFEKNKFSNLKKKKFLEVILTLFLNLKIFFFSLLTKVLFLVLDLISKFFISLKKFLKMFSLKFWKERSEEKKRINNARLQKVVEIMGESQKRYLQILREEELEKEKWLRERKEAEKALEARLAAHAKNLAEIKRKRDEEEKALKESNEKRWGKKS